MSVAERLKSLGIAVPPVAIPAAAYVPFAQTGNLVFLSGHIARYQANCWLIQSGWTLRFIRSCISSMVVSCCSIGGDPSICLESGKTKARPC